MKMQLLAAGIIILAFALSGCGSAPETVTEQPVRAPMSKEGLYTRGQQLWFEKQADSAAAYFLRAAAMDSAYNMPLRDLAQMQYERAMLEPEKSKKRMDLLRSSRAQFVRVEARGEHESDVYERLCELSSSLGDDRTFLLYAKKNAELYPYDRQVFNMARAYYDAEDYQGVIRTAKEAVEKFKESQYLGSFWRILGKAYTKIDRDQTAERTLVAGLKATDGRIAALKNAGGDYKSTDAYRRLHEDKVQMLLILKQLHTTYKAQDKLEQVERQLKKKGTAVNALSPLACLYGAAVRVRNAAFDHGVLPVYRPPVPVIAVGNLTAGGTGKTPVVGWILGYLRKRGVRPVVLSRGYGRRTKGVVVVADGTTLLKDAGGGGDEPVQLARSFPDVPVVVGESRAAAAREALARFVPDVLVLDDAFQHRAIARDLDVVIVDGSRDLAVDGLLPAGRRREPLSALRRASVVVFSHPDPLTGRVEGESTVRAWFHGDCARCTRTIGSFVESGGTALAPERLRDERCVLVSGIANPDRFERDVRGLGLTVMSHLRYRDHYRYTPADVQAMVKAVSQHEARLVTTEKDMVRLMAVSGAMWDLEVHAPVTAAVLHVQVEPAGLLESRIDALLGRTA